MQGPPPTGEVWVESRLLALLGRKLGDAVAIGGLSLRLAGVLVQEPDRGGSLFQFAPRVIMNPSDLAASSLLGPASRDALAELLQPE